MADRARHHGRLEKAGMQGRAMAWRATCLHGLEQASVHRRALAWRANHQVGLGQASVHRRALAWRANHQVRLEQASVHRRALAWRATHQVGLEHACVYGRAKAWRANHVGELKWLVGQECIGALGHARERARLAVQGRQGIVWLWEQCFSSRYNGSHRRRSSTSASYILHLDLEWGGRWGVVRSWGGRDALCAACTGGMGRVMVAAAAAAAAAA